MKRSIVAEDAPRVGGPYSHAIAAREFVFLAGQGPADPETGEFADDFEAQARQTFRNLAAVATAAGGSLADAVKVSVFLKDMNCFEKMNEVYREFFPEPWPARTTIQSGLRGIQIEIDAILFLAS